MVKIATGKFKALCLKLMALVRPEKPLFGYMKGSAKTTGDIAGPTIAKWEADKG
jgi:hypothetical protein